MAPFVAGLIDGSNPAPNAHPHIEEIRERYEARGVDDVTFFPGSTVELAREDLDHVTRLAAALR
jgi:hypothetical protein